MKYTIEGFNQEVLVSMKLDAADAIILRYIVDFYSTGKMVKVEADGKQYFWIKYGAVIEQVPIIGIKSKVALARRFDKYVACGLMEKVLWQHAGNYTCFRFTEAYEGLVSKVEGSTQKYIGSQLESTKGLNSKVQTKDSSTNHSSTREYTPEFNTFWNAYPRNTNKMEAFKKFTARIKEGETAEHLTMCATNYSAKLAVDKTEAQFYMHASTFLGPNRRFEDFETEVKAGGKPSGEYTDKNDVVWKDGIKQGHYDGGRFIPA